MKKAKVTLPNQREKSIMSNSTININFLTATDIKTRTEILKNIAEHYGITTAEAYKEVIDEEAEHLLDYVTGSVRTATSVLMQRHSIHRD